MWPIVTDGVAWSVCRSVGMSVWNDRVPCKTVESIEMPFGLWTHVDPRNYALDGVQIAHGKVQF